MTTYVALLRGINVGGNNLVKMAALREMLGRLGFQDIQTLLQSGNVVFRSDDAAPELECMLEAATAEEFGVRPAYVVRSGHEWNKVVARNPFPDFAEAEPGHLLVHFFKASLDDSQVAEVSSRIQGPERIIARGREMYVVYPDGVGRSTIGKTPGWNRLAAAGTARNWNTVLKLAAILGD